MTSFDFDAASEADTDRFGAELAAVLPPGTTIALSGTLGAGKTRLVQAIAAGCGVDREEVVSPTFVLCQRYQGDRTIYHLDAYRLRDDEFRELGPEEFFESDGLTIIEWADKVESILPAEQLRIEIEIVDENRRLFAITATGKRYEELLSSLGERGA